MNKHTRHYLDGRTYAVRMRLMNKRNIEVAKIQAALVPVRTQKEVAEIMGCTKSNIHQAERRILWKIATRMRASVNH